jgi:hypothetical protein
MTSVEVSDKRTAFCARLKSERERRGRSLADIAASTKIKASLLDALERGDLSRWPKGIYRRSFFREYVADIGLHPDPFISEFLDVFADAAPPSSKAASAGPSEPVSFRIVFADEMRSATPTTPASRDLTREARLVAAAIDVLAIATLAAVVAAVAPVSFAVTGATLGAIAYLLFTWFDATPGTWLLRYQSRPASATPVQTFAPSSLPYNAYAPTPGSPAQSRVALASRVREMLAGSLERVMDAPSWLFNPQRRRELNSIRRRRLDAANSPADEFSVT